MKRLRGGVALGVWAVAVVVGALAGCAEPPVEKAAIGVAEAAIKGGESDVVSKGVVAITRVDSLCTGSLIAPNVVLTARHCVSSISGQGSAVSCESSTTSAPFGAKSFFVTTADVVTPGNAIEYLVEEVRVPPVDNLLCGNDIAILILSDNVSGIEPYLPRLDDAPLGGGEPYSAVGYGAGDGAGAEPGTRRRRDGLTTTCVGPDCFGTTPFGDELTATEWVGNGGVCQGDSGGPALDVDDRVIGVTSRGSNDCDLSIYTSTVAYGPWLRDTVVYASGMGLYDPPSWTAGSTVNREHSMPIGDACASDADCPTGKCLEDGDDMYCTRACEESAPCPEDYVCETSSFGMVCVDGTAAANGEKVYAYKRPSGGCGLSGGTPERAQPWLWMGLGLWLLARRRRGRA
mgnify:CR=1 FL=1